MNNLVSNALKYSDGDLEIILSDEGVLRVSNSSEHLSNVEETSFLIDFSLWRPAIGIQQVWDFQ